MNGVIGAFPRSNLRERDIDYLCQGPLSSCLMVWHLASMSTFYFCGSPCLLPSEEPHGKAPNTRPLRKMLENQMGFVFWGWEMRLDVNFKERPPLSLPATRVFEMSCSKFGNCVHGPPQGKCQLGMRQWIPQMVIWYISQDKPSKQNFLNELLTWEAL